LSSARAPPIGDSSIAGAPSGGRGASRLQSEAEKILQAAIEDFYLTNQKYSVKKTSDNERSLGGAIG
jgi:hypothetical protein